MADTKQTGLKRNDKGQIIGGTPPAGFNVNPQNRSNGAWKKEDTARFKLEQMMKLGDTELFAVTKDPDAPHFEKKLAKAMIDGEWRDIKEMMQEVYGKPKESVDITTGGEPMVALVRFVGGPEK